MFADTKKLSILGQSCAKVIQLLVAISLLYSLVSEEILVTE